MGKSNVTEVAILLDRSGSMGMTKDDVIGGFNAFIEEQKKLEGEVKVTVALFDHEYKLLYDGVSIHEVEPLTNANYVPRGTTALLDGIGKLINDIGSKDCDCSNCGCGSKDKKTIMMILTDGAENASKEMNKEKVLKMINDKREKRAWDVLFIGANEDTMGDASSLGLSGASLNADKILAGNISTSKMKGFGSLSADSFTTTAYVAMNQAVTNVRSMGSVGNWMDLGDDDDSNN